jgi:hypothetical protein
MNFVVAWGGIEPPTRGFSIFPYRQQNRQRASAKFYKSQPASWLSLKEFPGHSRPFVEG